MIWRISKLIICIAYFEQQEERWGGFTPSYDHTIRIPPDLYT